MARENLRTGFSTGSAAAAAARAALLTLLEPVPPVGVSIPLPSGERLEIAVAAAERLDQSTAWATVIKDGGDDPDATHKAAITARVRLAAPGPGHGSGVKLAGGPGVGRITRPGLPLAVGEPAINPVPRQMIAAALEEAWQAAGRPGTPAVEVEISVADGEKIAKHTLNPRLGIVGGISILGTTGLVKPFSHEAYTATIDSALKVAAAAGITEIVFTTGGKSEKRAMALRPDLNELAFVQIADFFGYAFERAGQEGFARLGLVSFFGKAVKQAQGLVYTHAHKAPMELDPLAAWLREAGAAEGLARQVRGANTARHALEMLREAGRLDLARVCGPRMLTAMRGFAGPGPALWAMILDYDGALLFEGRQEGDRP
ncbi:MAG: cobalt-precorrin-5B (C(1))-methyltransferase [Deltaproteobacteria bacterium]|nr:cobalt-precorrin-5B (C(1))-methyltransferase [Deltaproteobacteria bacterium]